MPKPEIKFKYASTFLTVHSTSDLSTTILSHDKEIGDQTLILKITPGSSWGEPVCKHEYWEECYILVGRLFDERLGKWFGAGHCRCRPPGMLHGPYRADEKGGCKELCLVRYEKK